MNKMIYQSVVPGDGNLKLYTVGYIKNKYHFDFIGNSLVEGAPGPLDKTKLEPRMTFTVEGNPDDIEVFADEFNLP